MNLSQLRVALWTLIYKEVRRFMRIWPQTLLPPAITMSLYFVIFGNLVGSRIGEMAGFSYMQFIVPGLIMMSVITNSYSNVCSSFFSAKFQHSIEELITSPTPMYLVLWGYVIGGICRGVCVGFIVTLVSLFFTHLGIYNFFVTIYTVVVTSLLFSLAGFINAFYAKSFDDISIVPTFILTPLTYLGGVFYSMSSLSAFWQNLSLINPIVYMVNAFRYGILGHSDVNVIVSLVIMTIFCAVFYAIAYYLLSRGSGIRE
ncbi:ABC transporter permease [Acinetobacter sp. B5B]|uniref:ABC transporter permease n=1 Tax=Acinetobacter baretiae TaxID=2605383 RepID=UPI0018C24030|nr:ABC transporter permease [Acinetobacter baretiae]MBF7681993.1 ABC transporter permease [Acinetobacter baretiae]MBF7684762.1 ABC transporter permease [Acinetobacter baretiae]